jgi:hypothetical protein
MDCFIIDNSVVSRVGSNSVRISSISLAKRLHNIDVDTLPKLTCGNRFQDNVIINKLADGILKFDDIYSLFTTG